MAQTTDDAPAPLGAAEGAASPTLSWILLLAGVTAIGPFSMQAIAPGLPALSEALSIGPGAAQSMISLAMVSMALGAVVYGPLADHYGRRPVLLGGLAVSAAGAAIAAVALNFEWALLGRVAQSLGAGAGMVLARAAAQDLFAERAAATIGQITAAMVLAPMFAPAIGGVLTQAFGWRAIFALVALASLALLLVAFVRFSETARSLSPRLALGAAAADYGAIIRRRAFLAYAGFGAAGLASFFLFVSGAPYVMERAFGVGPGLYGAMFVGAAIIYMLGNLISARVTDRLGGPTVMALGAGIGALGCAVAGAALWALGSAGGAEAAEPNVMGAAILMAGVCFHSIGAGLTTPLAIAGAVASFPERAGSASSLLSVAQFSAAALAAQAATALPLDQAAPLAFCMAALTALSWGLYRVFRADIP